MPDEMNTDERAKFEAALKDLCATRGSGISDGDLSRDAEGAYDNGTTEVAWMIWQARAAMSPTTEDMASVSAQGFRDGVASLSAAEPQSCGHPASMMLASAETGEPLYCELCDSITGRRDAETMEAELRQQLVAIKSRNVQLIDALKTVRSQESDLWAPWLIKQVDAALAKHPIAEHAPTPSPQAAQQAPSTSASGGWMPIETAPKDGTEILLYAPPQEYEGKPIEARKTYGKWLAPSDTPHINYQDGFAPESEWDDFDAHWSTWDGGFTPENPPTHWQPLPASPTIEGESK